MHTAVWKVNRPSPTSAPHCLSLINEVTPLSCTLGSRQGECECRLGWEIGFLLPSQLHPLLALENSKEVAGGLLEGMRTAPHRCRPPLPPRRASPGQLTRSPRQSSWLLQKLKLCHVLQCRWTSGAPANGKKSVTNGHVLYDPTRRRNPHQANTGAERRREAARDWDHGVPTRNSGMTARFVSVLRATAPYSYKRSTLCLHI